MSFLVRLVWCAAAFLQAITLPDRFVDDQTDGKDLRPLRVPGGLDWDVSAGEDHRLLRAAAVPVLAEPRVQGSHTRSQAPLFHSCKDKATLQWRQYRTTPLREDSGTTETPWPPELGSPLTRQVDFGRVKMSTLGVNDPSVTFRRLVRAPGMQTQKVFDVDPRRSGERYRP